MSSDFHELKSRFQKELDGIKSIDELKELYATELAKRDQIIDELRTQNELILKSAVRNKKIELGK